MEIIFVMLLLLSSPYWQNEMLRIVEIEKKKTNKIERKYFNWLKIRYKIL